MITLSFSETIRYKESITGMLIPVMLSYGPQAFWTDAKVDPGAEVCLFKHEEGSKLGLLVERGIPITLGTLAGSMEAFGHEVTRQTGDLIFQSLVYFAKYPHLPRNILGRRGWLRNLKLAVIDYDNLLHLSSYDE